MRAFFLGIVVLAGLLVMATEVTAGKDPSKEAPPVFLRNTNTGATSCINTLTASGGLFTNIDWQPFNYRIAELLFTDRMVRIYAEGYMTADKPFLVIGVFPRGDQPAKPSGLIMLCPVKPIVTECNGQWIMTFNDKSQ